MLSVISTAAIFVFSAALSVAQEEATSCSGGVFIYEPVALDGSVAPDLTMEVFRRQSATDEIIPFFPTDLLEETYFNKSKNADAPDYALALHSLIYKISDLRDNSFYMAKLAPYGSSYTPEMMIYFDEFSPSGGSMELLLSVSDIDIENGVPFIIGNLREPDANFNGLTRSRDSLGAEYILFSSSFRRAGNHYLSRFFSLGASGELVAAANFAAGLTKASGTWRLTGCKEED